MEDDAATNTNGEKSLHNRTFHPHPLVQQIHPLSERNEAEKEIERRKQTSEK